MEAAEHAEHIAQDMQDYSFTKWERMPDLELYMDQVLLYVNKQLMPLRQPEAVTSSMVNNYVKDGLVDRPVHKRYDRDRLAQLLMVAELKQVLQMPDIALLMQRIATYSTKQQAFAQFTAMQCRAYNEVAQRVSTGSERAQVGGTAELEQLALELTLEADARKAAAEKLIDILRNDRTKGL